ncbi:MAG TPA: Crp/Fnr family transcriptional regulator [Chitinophagales bacterium]|nr:Crp/Fnr family transcriptional regulator [Chitinophagales bacterium]
MDKTGIPSCENCQSRSVSVFCSLKPDELKELSLSKGCYHFTKKQTIFFEGARPTGIYCIYSGKIKVYKIREDGRTQIVRLAKKGDILGYRSLLSGELYTSFATVMEDAVVCYIPKSVFFRLIRQNSDFSLRVMDLLARGLWHAEEKIASMAMKPVRERVAESLILLKDFYGLKDDNVTLDISLSREELASIAGTSMETVVRLLADLKNEKIIAINKKVIRILDAKKLFDIAHLYD